MPWISECLPAPAQGTGTLVRSWEAGAGGEVMWEADLGSAGGGIPSHSSHSKGSFLSLQACRWRPDPSDAAGSVQLRPAGGPPNH